jgi:hypothetical protein
MDRKIVLGVLGFIVVLVTIGFLLPDKMLNDKDTLPWHIEHPTPQTTHVLGITLGQSTVPEAERKYQEKAEYSLFKSPDGKMGAEIFFEEVVLNGLKAKVTLTVDVPQAEIGPMYERGLRMSATGSGSKRITMQPDDVARVRTLPITSLTYIPVIKLDEQVLQQRFGTPAQKVRETKNGVVHWLYPDHGLDMTVPTGDKPIFQYVTPNNFELLRKPLLAEGEVLQ